MKIPFYGYFANVLVKELNLNEVFESSLFI